MPGQSLLAQMASTYAQLQCHLVFSTKFREPWIDGQWEDQLHSYLAGCLRKFGCHPLEIGGHVDHVHLLSGIKPRHRLSDVVCDIKSGSSRWIHESIGLDEFEWQEGYGAFSTSVRETGELRAYIRNQKARHQVKTFLEEYQELLDEAGIKWDPKYLA